MVLFTKLPCLLRADLDAILPVYNNDRRVSRCDSLLHLSDEVKIARGIKNIDLAVIPDDRSHRGID